MPKNNFTIREMDAGDISQLVGVVDRKIMGEHLKDGHGWVAIDEDKNIFAWMVGRPDDGLLRITDMHVDSAHTHIEKALKQMLAEVRKHAASLECGAIICLPNNRGAVLGLFEDNDFVSCGGPKEGRVPMRYDFERAVGTDDMGDEPRSLARYEAMIFSPRHLDSAGYDINYIEMKAHRESPWKLPQFARHLAADNADAFIVWAHDGNKPVIVGYAIMEISGDKFVVHNCAIDPERADRDAIGQYMNQEIAKVYCETPELRSIEFRQQAADFEEEYYQPLVTTIVHEGLVERMRRAMERMTPKVKWKVVTYDRAGKLVDAASPPDSELRTERADDYMLTPALPPATGLDDAKGAMAAVRDFFMQPGPPLRPGANTICIPTKWIGERHVEAAYEGRLAEAIKPANPERQAQKSFRE